MKEICQEANAPGDQVLAEHDRQPATIANDQQLPSTENIEGADT